MREGLEYLVEMMSCLLGPLPLGLLRVGPTQEGETLETQQVSQGLIFRYHKLPRFLCISETFYMATQAYSLTSDVLRYHFLSDFILDVHAGQSVFQHVAFQTGGVGRLDPKCLGVQDGFEVNHHAVEVVGLRDQGVQGSMPVEGAEGSCLELLI